MKTKAFRPILLLALGSLVLGAGAAVAQVRFQKAYGGGNSEVAQAVVGTADGGFLIAGWTYGFGAGLSDLYAVRIDGAGNLLWSRTYGGSSYDWAQAVVGTSDGGFLLVGRTESFGAGFADLYAVRIDGAGNLLWSRTYGGSSYEEAWAVVGTSDGGFLLAGRTASFGAGGPDLYAVRIDGTGDSGCNQATPVSQTTTPTTETSSFPPIVMSPSTTVTTPATQTSTPATQTTTLCMAPPSALSPTSLGVIDPNGNGVWDSGETATVVPTWQNNGAAAVSATGTAGNVVVPPDVMASLTDTTADYGTIAAGASADCQTATGDCYAITGTRTAWGHWDVTIDETLTAVWALQQPAPKTWTLHIGPSFADVATNVFYYKPVETLLHRGITGGCTATDYCPLGTATRWQTAIFISRAKLGADPPASGSGPGGSWNCTDNAPNQFTDVPDTVFYCPHVHWMWANNIAGGCTATTYCPDDPVNRAQMAIFISRAVLGTNPPASGSGPGGSWNCTDGNPNPFTDVPDGVFYCPHAHWMWANNVTGGCTATQYCPLDPVNRAQMATFLVRAFNLLLYEP